MVLFVEILMQISSVKRGVMTLLGVCSVLVSRIQLIAHVVVGKRNHQL
jgi:hypothetical protein